MSDIHICIVALKDSNVCTYLVQPRWKYGGYITDAVTSHNIMEATGDTSKISATARKM